MSMDDPMANYASVPMPYPGHGTLLSEWPASFQQQVYREPAPIEPSILANHQRMGASVSYSPVPPGYVRFPYRADSGHSDSRHSRGGHSGRGRRA